MHATVCLEGAGEAERRFHVNEIGRRIHLGD